ncbi:hypothetical protein [Anaeromyxobacter sp. SG66]|uniref:hypothetical protein n=1 Tax=Anaeromyxobacter sp. SG66 TaxID=2925410 RepID=UPI001F58C22B|nr:hypothetical protein [Anaeromyxobacter sp. SG66]
MHFVERQPFIREKSCRSCGNHIFLLGTREGYFVPFDSTAPWLKHACVVARAVPVTVSDSDIEADALVEFRQATPAMRACLLQALETELGVAREDEAFVREVLDRGDAEEMQAYADLHTELTMARARVESCARLLCWMHATLTTLPYLA